MLRTAARLPLAAACAIGRRVPARPLAIRAIIGAVLVVLATVMARAQTTTAVLPLPASWGAVEVERFIETDGDPATVEVLIWRYSDFQWRIVAVQADGALCAGPWFSFIHDQGAWPRIIRIGAVDVAFMTQVVYERRARTWFFTVALDHPTACLP